MLEREELSREHADLMALVATLTVALAEPTPDMARLSATRWRLSRVLLLHLAKEDNLLYPQLARSPVPATAQLARRFASEVCGLAQDYTAYTRRWPVDRIDAEWTLFGEETRGILSALARRIAREEAELYPCIAPPPPPAPRFI